MITQYRVLLAEEAHQWAEAERLQRIRVEWNRKRATSALAVTPEFLTGSQKNTLRSLAASLHELGDIYRHLKRPECIPLYEEALSLSQQISERSGAAVCAFNLGHCYKDLLNVRDLSLAEHWYRRSLELYDETARHDRAQCLGQLGLVAYEHFEDAQKEKRPIAEVLSFINDALHRYHEALNLIPSDAITDLGTVHHQLGLIYDSGGLLDRALIHYREAIKYRQASGDLYAAAGTCFNVALTLANASRFADAWDYANAALRDYETFGDRAADKIQITKALLAQIEEDLRNQKGENV